VSGSPLRSSFLNLFDQFLKVAFGAEGFSRVSGAVDSGLSMKQWHGDPAVIAEDEVARSILSRESLMNRLGLDDGVCLEALSIFDNLKGFHDFMVTHHFVIAKNMRDLLEFVTISCGDEDFQIQLLA